MTEHNSDAVNKQRLRELLPFHANQTLDAAQTEQVHAGLQQYPELAAELAWLEGMRKTMQDQPLDPLPVGDLGWSALAVRIEAQRKSKFARSAPASGGWSERLRAWLQRNFIPVMATACSLLVAQAVVIAALMQQDPNYVAAGASEPALGASTGVLLHVTIGPTVTQAQLSETLHRYKATIVQGPTALGIYTLQIKPASTGETELRNPAVFAQRLQREAATVFETVTPAGDR
ncbi:hypothetical protein [Polaromonas sp.]|uniref:hypothetical protein n=1 Tax=Polaromonas sp. TaxID=1869339 RepID=UPI003266E3AB